ncbi:MAG: hypothetical protein [Olavius algarvensis Delta 4 endosymbiont]|nr:MAG: hypothetical protein [Olavius algarvensis Delta 4 endosymbiont]
MKYSRTLLKILFLSALILSLSAGAYASDDSLRIEPAELNAMLNQQDLTVIDVRRVSDWRGSDRKIAGAVRKDPHNVSAWATKSPKQNTYVIYCA